MCTLYVCLYVSDTLRISYSLVIPLDSLQNIKKSASNVCSCNKQDIFVRAVICLSFCFGCVIWIIFVNIRPNNRAVILGKMRVILTLVIPCASSRFGLISLADTPFCPWCSAFVVLPIITCSFTERACSFLETVEQCLESVVLWATPLDDSGN